MRCRSPAKRMSKPSWTKPSRLSLAPTPTRSSISTMPCSSTPARMRLSTYSRLRRSMTTVSIPARCSSWPRSSPAGPEPTTATWTRTLPPSQQGFDFPRGRGRQRSLGERERNRSQAEQAVQIQRPGRTRAERVEVGADHTHVAARDHAAERAGEAELLDVVRGSVEQRQQRAHRLLLRDAELLPQRDGLGDERHDEGAGEIGSDVIERPSALGQRERPGPQRAREARELLRERAGSRNRDRAPAPLQCTQADPLRQRMPDATAEIASSGTVRNAMSARSATSCADDTARAPRRRRARARAEAALRLVTATTLRPARASDSASPVPTRPAPMMPMRVFFAPICYQLYGVARRRQIRLRSTLQLNPRYWDVSNTGIPFSHRSLK